MVGDPRNTDTNDWIDIAARFGYGSKMIVYGLLGVLAMLAAYGSRGTGDLSQSGVFQKILQQPFGKTLLGLLAAGLFCYAFWRLVQAFKNTENLGSDAKDRLKRAFFVVTALIYASGGFAAASMVMGSGGSSSSGGSGDKTEDITARLMGYEGGLWLVGVLGALVLLFSFIQFRHAWKADFLDKFRLGEMSEKEVDASRTAGIGGYAARGVVYLMVGVFFIQAAWTANPQEAGGMQEALTTLIQQPYGPWLLGLVGGGLLAYGVFCGFEAFYRKTKLD